jgi:hypothetical protein
MMRGRNGFAHGSLTNAHGRGAGAEHGREQDRALELAADRGGGAVQGEAATR